jgi:hypothetical protein
MISAGSILFESGSRRNEITYYVSAKALMALYIFFKRYFGWRGINEGAILHVVLMGAFNYLYNHRPDLLKFKQIFGYVVG